MLQAKMLQRLEFDKIKKQLEAHAETSLGKEKVEQLVPFCQYDQVAYALAETDEALTAMRLKGEPTFGGIRDIREKIKRATIGSILHADEFVDIVTTISAARRIKQYMESVQKEKSELPILMSHSSLIQPCRELEAEINRCIDRNGNIVDDASPELRNIRRQMKSYESQIREKLEQILRTNSHKLSDALITIRNDRYVIPVKAEYRASFGGIVHDESASGQTVFIEPHAVVAINNQLREAQNKEKQEIEKILRKLTEQVAAHSEVLLTNIEQLAALDFIFAKARYAKHIKATKPKLNERACLNFINARHPLIPPETVVPISVRLGDEYRTMVITGPNTGGKTVTLKTIGLLSLMVQAGLFIPVDEGSEAAVFEHVFADIGDEQSIEQSLSTFSSHMTNIVSILNHMTEQSLVLFDELGAGTDPEEGAALAIAILDHIHRIGACCVATTHYSELKTYAYNREGVINASVEFDVETLKPTYRLIIGVPGRSNAFEISKRLGLHPDIIDAAKRQMSTETNRVEKMLTQLETLKKQAEKELEEAKKQREIVEREKRFYEKQKQILENEKARILKAAEEKASEALEQAKREAEAIIQELRQYKTTGVKEHVLIDAKKRLEETLPTLTESKPTEYLASNETFSVGDEVELVHLSQKGTIVEEMNEDEYLVQVGMMKINVKANQLKKRKEKSQPEQFIVTVKNTKTAVKTELDIRGMRYEDAKIEVDRYLDDAILAGYSQVSIIHGKGTGALRKGVHEWLRKHPHVKSFRLGREGEGGLGVTIVDLQ